VTQENCCQACNRTKYGIGKVIDLFEEDVARNVSGPALGKNGTNNMFGFTQVAVDIVHAHAASNVRRRLRNWAPRPLFLYAALHNTHAPFEVPRRFEALYTHSFRPQNVWSGMVSRRAGVRHGG
jgi:hypothetical protein